MTRSMRTALVVSGMLALLAPGRAWTQADEPLSRGEKVDGYAEWRAAGCLIVDGQRVCAAPGMKFKGGGDAKDFASVPLGYEVKAKGGRQNDGSLLAREVEAKPNGAALFEGEVRSVTDAAESRARERGRFFEDEAATKSVGRLHEEGPYVDRVRRIVDSLLPPYLHPEDVRIYVIENDEWNAFAMGNYSIYVFTGLLDDMDDDEVAMVIGHELVHATHEHSRKQFKRDMWVQLAALGVLAASSQVEDDKKRAVLQLATGLAATAYSSGYGRSMEDQADRVGLRYAYEAGYDITKGPRLWSRFAQRYGDGNKIVNFFFADHSQSTARATKLEKEIAYNYPDGPKSSGPARTARRRPTPPASTAAYRPPAPAPAAGSSQALAGTARPRVAPSPAQQNVEIEPGMTPKQVRDLMGEPASIVTFGAKTRWTFPDLTIVFEKGKVVDVLF